MDTIKYYSIPSVPSRLEGVKTRPEEPPLRFMFSFVEPGFPESCIFLLIIRYWGGLPIWYRPGKIPKAHKSQDLAIQGKDDV